MAIKKDEYHQREVIENGKVVTYAIPPGRVNPEIVEMKDVEEIAALEQRSLELNQENANEIKEKSAAVKKAAKEKQAADSASEDKQKAKAAKAKTTEKSKAPKEATAEGEAY